MLRLKFDEISRLEEPNFLEEAVARNMVRVGSLSAAFFTMRNLAKYCGVITVTVILGVLVGARAGCFPVGRVVIPDPDIIMAVCMIGVLILCGPFAIIAHRARKHLTRELMARNTKPEPFRTPVVTMTAHASL